MSNLNINNKYCCAFGFPGELLNWPWILIFKHNIDKNYYCVCAFVYEPLSDPFSLIFNHKNNKKYYAAWNNDDAAKQNCFHLYLVL